MKSAAGREKDGRGAHTAGELLQVVGALLEEELGDILAVLVKDLDRAME